ncbi:MAG TPA: hypothetical protein VFZ52_20170 [Chryseolinea sp.]
MFLHSIRNTGAVNILVSLLLFPLLAAGQAPKLGKSKSRAMRYIEDHKEELASWSDRIWEFAEPSLKETMSCSLLVNILKGEGFEVKENIAGMPTVFSATFGNRGPVVGLFGEYDADPDASNKTVPRKDALVAGGFGHGGHHNLLAIGSLGAALAVKKLIQDGQLDCTIRYYGTTAEGTIGAKTFLARDGHFDDLDFSLYWHPAPSTWASTKPWDALIDFDIILSAPTANVVRDNKFGATTLDALELVIEELRTIRRKATPAIRMNYSIDQESSDRSETADTVRLSVRIQCASQEDAIALFQETKTSVAKAVAGLNQSASVNVVRAFHQFLPNVTGMSVVQKNMEMVGPVHYTNEDQAYTTKMQRELQLAPEGIQDKTGTFSDQSNTSAVYGYASDIGDASWIAPEVYFVVKTLPPVPMHQWPATAFSAHAIGHKGMIKASKILCLTIIDFVESKELQRSIHADFVRAKKSYIYRSLLTPGISTER